jgi:ParB family chromosome partitioning protein
MKAFVGTKRDDARARVDVIRKDRMTKPKVAATQEIPSRAEAIQERKECIAELREGNKRERRQASLLAQCRRGHRCNLDECPVCERRVKLAASRIPTTVVKSISGSFTTSFIVRKIAIDAVKVIGTRRPLNEEKVLTLAASMAQIGLRTPITVRMQKKKVILVSGWHRLAAAKRLGLDSIPCFVLPDDDIATRLWEIAENLHRAELTVLERAEHIEEWRTLVQTKNEEGQVAPPGGRQPGNVGINKTAKALGLTKEEIRRAKAMAGISAKAKAEARKLGLDNNQSALLQVAKLTTSKAQLMATRQIIERKRAARSHSAAAISALGDKKATAEIKAIESNITEKTETLDGLKKVLAAQRQRLSELEGEIVADCVDETMIDATITRLPMAPDDQDTPAILKPVLVSRKDKASFKALVKAWDNASPRVHKRFKVRLSQRQDRK